LGSDVERRGGETCYLSVQQSRSVARSCQWRGNQARGKAKVYLKKTVGGEKSKGAHRETRGKIRNPGHRKEESGAKEPDSKGFLQKNLGGDGGRTKKADKMALARLTTEKGPDASYQKGGMEKAGRVRRTLARVGGEREGNH